MARILVADPTPEVRRLIVHVVARLGHEPVVLDDPRGQEPSGVDAAILEPVFEEGLDAVLALRAVNPALPIVCASIHPRSTAVSALEPVAFILKPFHVRDLADAVHAAVAAADEDPADAVHAAVAAAAEDPATDEDPAMARAVDRGAKS